MQPNSVFDLVGLGPDAVAAVVLSYVLNPFLSKIESNEQKKRVVYVASIVVAIVIAAFKGHYAKLGDAFSGGVTISVLWAALSSAVAITVGSWGFIAIMANNVYDKIIHPEKKMKEEKKAEAFLLADAATQQSREVVERDNDIEARLKRQVQQEALEELAKKTGLPLSALTAVFEKSQPVREFNSDLTLIPQGEMTPATFENAAQDNDFVNASRLDSEDVVFNEDDGLTRAEGGK